ncbi:MAG: hypothetical protein GWN71_08485 [Gammaproteobacteria bacterium]|nr:hypothetical protein [Gemmatimonadota bacterium]NIU73604.1 hypothetical protein [Gammaproteobacteria bacterium]
MPITIVNRSKVQVLLRFNSGLTRRLDAGQSLEGVESVEVKGNARIKRLEALRLIAVQGAEARKAKRSADMTAEDAAEHIRSTPLAELEDFLSPGERRVTVLRELERKREEEG